MSDIVLTASPARPEVTSAVTRGTARLLLALDWPPLMEVGLPNGRRADLMAVTRKGELIIIEVKSGLEDFRTDGKWPEYAPWCDRFYFAVAPEFPRHILPPEPGLIVADAFDGAVVREPPVTPLASARRRALILSFGRLAAVRAATWPAGSI